MRLSIESALSTSFPLQTSAGSSPRLLSMLEAAVKVLAALSDRGVASIHLSLFYRPSSDAVDNVRARAAASEGPVAAMAELVCESYANLSGGSYKLWSFLRNWPINRAENKRLDAALKILGFSDETLADMSVAIGALDSLVQEDSAGAAERLGIPSEVRATLTPSLICISMWPHPYDGALTGYTACWRCCGRLGVRCIGVDVQSLDTRDSFSTRRQQSAAAAADDDRACSSEDDDWRLSQRHRHRQRQWFLPVHWHLSKRNSSS